MAPEAKRASGQHLFDMIGMLFETVRVSEQLLHSGGEREAAAALEIRTMKWEGRDRAAFL